MTIHLVLSYPSSFFKGVTVTEAWKTLHKPVFLLASSSESKCCCLGAILLLFQSYPTGFDERFTFSKENHPPPQCKVWWRRYLFFYNNNHKKKGWQKYSALHFWGTHGVSGCLTRGKWQYCDRQNRNVASVSLICFVLSCWCYSQIFLKILTTSNEFKVFKHTKHDF